MEELLKAFKELEADVMGEHRDGSDKLSEESLPALEVGADSKVREGVPQTILYTAGHRQWPVRISASLEAASATPS